MIILYNYACIKFCRCNECVYINTIITRLLVLYQIYNHLTFGPMAFMLGDYKSDIALVGML